MKRSLWFCVAIAAAGLLACESDAGGAATATATATGDTAGGGAGNTGGTDPCAAKLNTSTDGTSACGPVTCQAGEYCANATGFCNPGCLSELDCTGGQRCALENATKDNEGRDVGTCQAPDPSCAGGGSPSPAGSCGDVQGVYSVKLDTASSNPECSSFFQNGDCTVAQQQCGVSWSCEKGGMLQSGELDAQDRYSFDLAVPGGSGTCAVSFHTGSWPHSFSMDCSGTGGGMAMVCKLFGTMK